MSERRWHAVTDLLPPVGQVVECATPGGDFRPLKFSSNLWWLPDGSMYVYFTPTHWRPLPPAETTGDDYPAWSQPHSPACSGDHETLMGETACVLITCHCGEPVVYGYDGDPAHHRGMCEHCDAVRCDAYPGACDTTPLTPANGA